MMEPSVESRICFDSRLKRTFLINAAGTQPALIKQNFGLLYNCHYIEFGKQISAKNVEHSKMCSSILWGPTLSL